MPARSCHKAVGRIMRRVGLSVLVVIILSLGEAIPVSAQQQSSSSAPRVSGPDPAQAPASSAPAKIDQRLDDLTQQVHQAQTSGDNAWMLTSAALVLLMTGPGLALFYGGLVRRKNVLA